MFHRPFPIRPIASLNASRHQLKQVRLNRTGMMIGTIIGLSQIGSVSFAQIERSSVGELAPASRFDQGVLDSANGGLDVNLWQGTSAARATVLINNIDLIREISSRQLVEAALLSSGVPPQANNAGEQEAFNAAKLGAILRLGNLAAYQQIIDRAPINANSISYVRLNVEKSLLGGQIDKSCQYADSIKDKTERKLPYWSKLRAFCHIVRGELPAAELTSDLIRRSGHNDAVFSSLLGALTRSSSNRSSGQAITLKSSLRFTSPLHMAMGQYLINSHLKPNPEGGPLEAPSAKIILSLPAALAGPLAMNTDLAHQSRLAALHQGASALNTSQIGTVLTQLAAAPTYKMDTGSEWTATPIKELIETRKWNAQQWGEAFSAVRQGTDLEMNAQLIEAIFTRAKRAGILNSVSKTLASDIAILSSQQQAKLAPTLLAKIATQKGDLGRLQALFSALEADNPVRARIALASDALGNGFILNDLGTDINERLTSDDPKQVKRAWHDALIAQALGATLSDEALSTALNVRPETQKTTISSGAMLGLADAAKRRAPAETALWAAIILANKPTSALSTSEFYFLLTSLDAAGLGKFARDLAARDFIGAQ